MVTKPADGIAAAPTAAATDVKLKNKHHLMRKFPIQHMARMAPNSVAWIRAKPNSNVHILHVLHVHRQV